MCKRRSNFYSLRPRTKEDREAFWNFRNADIIEMYFYYMIFQSMTWVLFLLIYVFTREESLVMQLFFLSAIYLPRFGVFLLSKKIKRGFSYLLIALFLATSACYVGFFSTDNWQTKTMEATLFKAPFLQINSELV